MLDIRPGREPDEQVTDAPSYYEMGRDQDPKTGRFLKGKKGGPGRKLGYRQDLIENFTKACFEEWQVSGPQALSRMAAEKPADFVKVIAGLMPRDVNLKVDSLPEQHLEALRQLNDMARQALELRARDITPKDETR